MKRPLNPRHVRSARRTLKPYAVTPEGASASHEAVVNILLSEDSTGCSSDLTVVSAAAVEALRGSKTAVLLKALRSGRPIVLGSEGPRAREGDAVESADLRGYDRIIAAAQRHGTDSEPDHEVGDLQDALRLCWSRLSTTQQKSVLAEYLQEHPDENGELRE